MPAICDPITSSLSQSFKKNETTKESFEASLAPSAKQILNANIEYEQVESYSSTVLSNLQTKYIVLKPDQPNLSSSILNGMISPEVSFIYKNLKYVMQLLLSLKHTKFHLIYRVYMASSFSELSSENIFIQFATFTDNFLYYLTHSNGCI